jgi:hypothetical protein
MPATLAAVPSLSQIQAWDTAHLAEAARSWGMTAEKWEDTFTLAARQMSEPGGVIWRGDAADAAQRRADGDAAKVRGMAAALRNAAAAACGGQTSLYAAKQAALSAIADAEAAGFRVGENLSVTSRQVVPLEEMAARQVQCRRFAAEIGARAAALSTLDNDIAAKITASIPPLTEVSFTEAPDSAIPHSPTVSDSTVEAASWRQGPNDGGEPAPPPAPPPIRGLPPDGVRPPVSGDLTQGPASRPSEQRRGGQSLWDDNGGEWRYFPGDKWHNPHWDYNPHNVPRGSEWQNVPIDNLPPRIGELPPVEAPAPPSVEAPPRVGGPPEGGAEGGGIGGGPAPVGPTLVPPPHSIHHLPVAGEDDLNAPWEYEH